MSTQARRVASLVRLPRVETDAVVALLFPVGRAASLGSPQIFPTHQSFRCANRPNDKRKPCEPSVLVVRPICRCTKTAEKELPQMTENVCEDLVVCHKKRTFAISIATLKSSCSMLPDKPGVYLITKEIEL